MADSDKRWFRNLFLESSPQEKRGSVEKNTYGGINSTAILTIWMLREDIRIPNSANDRMPSIFSCGSFPNPNLRTKLCFRLSLTWTYQERLYKTQIETRLMALRTKWALARLATNPRSFWIFPRIGEEDFIRLNSIPCLQTHLTKCLICMSKTLDLVQVQHFFFQPQLAKSEGSKDNYRKNEWVYRLSGLTFSALIQSLANSSSQHSSSRLPVSAFKSRKNNALVLIVMALWSSLVLINRVGNKPRTSYKGMDYGLPSLFTWLGLIAYSVILPDSQRMSLFLGDVFSKNIC